MAEYVKFDRHESRPCDAESNGPSLVVRKTNSLFRNMTALVLGMGIVLVSSGCLEREEKIVVSMDGSVDITLHYKGTQEEFDTLHASPFEAEPTRLENTKDKYEVSQSWHFAAGDQLPGSYASADDSQHLAFPTAVTVESTHEGTYYTFRRTYQPRRWNYIDYWHRQILENEDITELGEKDSQTLTLEERMEIVLAFANAEALRQIEMTDRAWKKSRSDAVTGVELTAHLKARRALLAIYDEDAIKQQIEPCLMLMDEPREQCLQRRGEQVVEAARRAYFATLADTLSLAEHQAVRQAYETEREYHQITSDTGGHSFEISVTLPGRIVEHNGLDKEVEDHTAEEDKGGKATAQTVSWQFMGQAFRDRSHEIVAVSFVPTTGE
ncbi:MAG: hypothetical protein ACPGXK_02170 [Phycisphaerae bacterium]